MKIAKEYFGLQIKWCKKWSEITGRDFFEVLPLYSDFLNRLWIGKKKGDVSEDFQTYYPSKNWKKFMKSYDNKRPVGSTYEYYLKELKVDEKRRVKDKPRTSAFRYDIEEDGKTMRIHTNTYYRENKFSPLSIKNIEFRKCEIKRCLLEVKKNHPKVKEVKGHSWYYNIEAYKRLFPKSYVKNPVETRWTIQGFSLWGQFLNKYGQVKRNLSKPFLKKVSIAKTVDDLWKAFPMMPLEVRGSIKDFYKMYL